MICVLNTMLRQPIDGYYLVEPDGNVSLGPAYGRANVKDLTAEQAEERITRQLQRLHETGSSSHFGTAADPMARGHVSQATVYDPPD